MRTICHDVGLSTEWYHKVLAGKIRDPGVRRVEKLHEYLVSKQCGNPNPDDELPPERRQHEVA